MIYVFDGDVAKEYGVNEAIMIANLQFWIAKNKACEKHFYDNHWWTYNSKEAFTKLFPFWSVQTVKTILNHLKEKGVIITGNYNKNAYDKTLWYAFADEGKWLKEPTIKKLEPVNRLVEINQTIPDINTDIIPDNNTPLLSPQGEKKPYGESQFVFLTDDEYAKVKETYGEFLDDAINTLDSYIASNPKKLAKKYSSHFAVLRKNNWVYKEIFGKRKQPLASNVTEDELNSFVDMWNTMANRLAPRGEFVNGNKVRSIVADDVRIMLPDAKRNLLCMINEIKNWGNLPLAINVPLDEGNYWNWALTVVANRLLRSSYLRGQAPNAPMFTFDVKFFCYNIKKLANPYDVCFLDR